jgi:2,3-bisphosphoglycerate-dependent phosphoglycerate mutase
MTLSVVFETHSPTLDNERGAATGWLPGELSEHGRSQAAELGRRRRDDGIAALFCSDLERAVQTARIAFAETPLPVLLDWRLRECDYGQRAGMPVAELHAGRQDYLDVPYPGGESWRQAVARVAEWDTARSARRRRLRLARGLGIPARLSWANHWLAATSVQASAGDAA